MAIIKPDSTIGGSSILTQSEVGSIKANNLARSNISTDSLKVLTLSDSSDNFSIYEINYSNQLSSDAFNASYSVSVSPSSIDEGSNLTVTVTTTNVANGTILYWDTDSPSDFTTSSGSFTINSSTGSFIITPTEDATTEGTESFTVRIRIGSTTGTIVSTSNSININDTSISPVTYTATPTSYTVNEGTALTINVLTTNVADGTSLYWTVTSPTEFSTTSGSFSITNNSGQFTVFPIIDGQNEGAEYFQVQIRTVSISGTVVETTSQITINNISANVVSVSAMTLPSGFYSTSSPKKFSNLSFGANGSQSSGIEYSLQSQYGQQTQITVEMWVNPIVRGDTIFGVSDPANSIYHGVDYTTNSACQWRVITPSTNGAVSSSAGTLARNTWGLLTVELSTSSNGPMVARWWLDATGNGATWTWQNNAAEHISSFGAITFAWWPSNLNRFNGVFGPVRVSKGLIYNGSPTVPTTTFQTTADTLLIIQ